MAEWLGSGLQSRVQQFESARRLHGLASATTEVDSAAGGRRGRICGHGGARRRARGADRRVRARLAGRPAAVYEADGTVGGIAKTVEYNGYRFDLGGHRFFTKFAPGRAAVAGDAGRGPARPPAAVAHLLQRQVLGVSAPGPRRRLAPGARRVGAAARCRTSAAGSHRRRHESRRSRTGSTQNFGQPHLRRFFRRTRRRCGACRARRSTPSGRRRGSRTSRSGRRCSRRSISRGDSTTLIEEFDYPRLGPGQMWEAFQARVPSAASRSTSPPRARRSTTTTASSPG